MQTVIPDCAPPCECEFIFRVSTVYPSAWTDAAAAEAEAEPSRRSHNCQPRRNQKSIGKTRQGKARQDKRSRPVKMMRYHDVKKSTVNMFYCEAGEPATRHGWSIRPTSVRVRPTRIGPTSRRRLGTRTFHRRIHRRIIIIIIILKTHKKRLGCFYSFPMSPFVLYSTVLYSTALCCVCKC